MIRSPFRLPDFALETYLERREFEARYYLCGSDSQSWTIDEILALGSDGERERWKRMTLGYVPVRGSDELRSAIASSYERIASDDVLCFAGAEEAIYCAMMTLLQPGDEAVVVVPAYQSAESVPASICTVRTVALDTQDGWRLDPQHLRTAITPRTKLLAINFPNNPTGAVPDLQTFREIVELCRRDGIYLFSDEVYRGIEQDSSRRLPQAADLYERALSLNVTSKAYGLAGLRVGWICNAAPSELLATIAIGAREAIFARNRAVVAKNLELLDDFFARHPDRFAWYHPDGGCVAFPRYLGTEGVDAFCEDLLARSGVLLLPGSKFPSSSPDLPADRFRIGFGRAGIEPHLAAFERYLQGV
jgi:aspartate/methionine/tyrosine aminotransferase